MAFKSSSEVLSTSHSTGNTSNSLRHGREIEALPTPFPNFDLGPVPSPLEVEAAVAALQSLLQEWFSLESMSKWLQPLMNSSSSSILHSRGYQLLCKGFQWILTDPTFKGLVISLCLDKDVWNAIRNHGIVEKLQELPSSGGNGNTGSSKQGPDFGNVILSWILQISLTKIRELIENFVSLLNNAFCFPGKEKLKPEKKDEIDEKIQSSLVLSLVVMLIVVVARVQIA
ncbi:uncharacterized protein E5676_scaffold266G003190 [Cucumis melo var. makuwa]|uniref:Uncharacterized protein n=2 Tax=Cucumis melo TaxID=3656 RepID=A0A5D3DM87_CUCMM|nr:uncharacterized protein LOC103498772 [Cucumis melo]KAA0053454.1 uncharacterized protein E6C27_scaffold46837G00010 [Cucumis melo var. makuwa]TYK24756.1 uncharacterized protein E5676_scaffold266G003190 [Cucumis melo var. makuwa]